MKNMIKIQKALKDLFMEDIGIGDVTSCAVIPEYHMSRATLIARETFILAGLPFVEKIFHLAAPGAKIKLYKKDGNSIKNDSVIAIISGNTRGLLAGERTALNLLQRLSGIATLTRQCVKRVEGLPVKIYDTRKTTPGLRFFEKYAVKTGGGFNHRFGLYDGILIKDNHISAVGSIEKAVRLVRKGSGQRFKVEIEVRNIREVRSALSSLVDIVLLDNMSTSKLKKAVKIIRGGNPDLVIEASGNITVDTVRAVAETGVDIISVGAITHSARAVDINMDITPVRSVH